LGHRLVDWEFQSLANADPRDDQCDSARADPRDDQCDSARIDKKLVCT
jgi:hypothetical protein